MTIRVCFVIAVAIIVAKASADCDNGDLSEYQIGAMRAVFDEFDVAATNAFASDIITGDTQNTGAISKLIYGTVRAMQINYPHTFGPNCENAGHVIMTMGYLIRNARNPIIRDIYVNAFLDARICGSCTEYCIQYLQY